MDGLCQGRVRIAGPQPDLRVGAYGIGDTVPYLWRKGKQSSDKFHQLEPQDQLRVIADTGVSTGTIAAGNTEEDLLSSNWLRWVR